MEEDESPSAAAIEAILKKNVVSEGRHRVKQKTAIYFSVAVISLSLAACFPAAADLVRIAQVQLPPYEIMTIIRSTGLEPLSRPVRRGSAYVLRAIDGLGEEVHVVVDAQRGQILSVQPVVPVAAPYGPPRYVPGPRYVDPRYVDPRYPPEPYYEYEPNARLDPGPPDPRGPRVIYAPRAATAPAGKTSPSAKAAPSAKSPASASKSAAVAPAKPPVPTAERTETSASVTSASDSSAAPDTTNATTPDAGKAAPAAPASSIPPVQTLEQ